MNSFVMIIPQRNLWLIQYITNSTYTPQYKVMWFGDGQLREEMEAVK